MRSDDGIFACPQTVTPWSLVSFKVRLMTAAIYQSVMSYNQKCKNPVIMPAVRKTSTALIKAGLGGAVGSAQPSLFLPQHEEKRMRD